MSKFIFVTGGVVSSLGKALSLSGGIIAGSGEFIDALKELLKEKQKDGTGIDIETFTGDLPFGSSIRFLC